LFCGGVSLLAVAILYEFHIKHKIGPVSLIPTSNDGSFFFGVGEFFLEMQKLQNKFLSQIRKIMIKIYKFIEF